MATFGFPKKERLARRKLWEAVFRDGWQIKAYPLLLYALKTPLPEAVPAQAGFAVPKRAFRKAADRNRIKRLMREAYRLEKPGIRERVQIFIPHSSVYCPRIELTR